MKTEPKDAGHAFLAGTGWVGYRCPCGFLMSARTMTGLDAAVMEHQASPGCPAFAMLLEAEAEIEVTK